MGYTIDDNGGITFSSKSPSRKEVEEAMAAAEKKAGKVRPATRESTEEVVEVASSVRETGNKTRRSVPRETGTRSVKRGKS